MENDSTGAAANADEAPASTGVTAPPAGRPPHTVLSVLLMALLSAGALYAVAWSLEDPDNIVHAWDFRKVAHDETPWRFPRLGKKQDGNGVMAMAWKTEPGPELIQNMDTAPIGQVAITLEVTRPSDNTPVPVTLEWYWASEADVEAADGAWPYTTERGVTLSIPDPERPNTHVTRLDHPKWTGTIDRGFIGLKFPDHTTGPFLLRLLRVEFLE